MQSKRGQVKLLISGGIAVVMIVGLVFTSFTIVGENRYVGQVSTSLVYDLANCKVNDLPRDDKINFGSVEEAHEKGYKDAPCNK